MTGGHYGGVDPTRGFDRVGDLSGFDLKKQVRKAKAQPADEGIIDGVTLDSIAAFVESKKGPGDHPVQSKSKGPLGLLRRLRER